MLTHALARLLHAIADRIEPVEPPEIYVSTYQQPPWEQPPPVTWTSTATSY